MKNSKIRTREKLQMAVAELLDWAYYKVATNPCDNCKFHDTRLEPREPNELEVELHVSLRIKEDKPNQKGSLEDSDS